MTPEDDLESSKGKIIHQLFVRSGDENYITARWCHLNELWVDFAWMGAQAIEKYLKAVLLINGHSVKSIGHDLPSLLESVFGVAHDLLPDCHEKMKAATRFNEIGSTDSRYRTYGDDVHMEDLHQLDDLVFAVRRLIHVLDKPRGYDMSEPTCRQILRGDSKFFFQKHGLPLELILKNPDHKLYQVLQFSNLSFFKPVVGTPVRHVATWSVSVLISDVLQPLVSDDCEQSKAAYQLAEWLISSVKLSKKDKKQIESEMCKAKQRYDF